MGDVYNLQQLALVVTFQENTDYDGTELSNVPSPLHPELTRDWLDALAEWLEENSMTMADLVDALRDARPRGWGS